VVLCYAAIATFFPKTIFALGCILPALLAVIGAAILARVYQTAHSRARWDNDGSPGHCSATDFNRQAFLASAELER
jgi:hypothetical protein